MRKHRPALAELKNAAPGLGELGALFSLFAGLHFSGITPAFPTRTFEKNLTISVGKKTVELLEAGPAHTESDVLVYLPESRVLFSGDILFIGGTPILWEGPSANVIAACDRILSCPAEIIVPGHGPVTGKQGVREVKDYWEYTRDEAKRLYEAGMPPGLAWRSLPQAGMPGWATRNARS